MMGFAAPATVAPAMLPAALSGASTTTGRPLLVAGAQPLAAVVLLDLVAKGASATP
jgi:hypothetical protein